MLLNFMMCSLMSFPSYLSLVPYKDDVMDLCRTFKLFFNFAKVLLSSLRV